MSGNVRCVWGINGSYGSQDAYGSTAGCRLPVARRSVECSRLIKGNTSRQTDFRSPRLTDFPSFNLTTRFALPLLLFLTSYTAHGQQRHSQSLYWTRYQVQVAFSPKIYWSTEVDSRRFFYPGLQNQLIVHSRVHRKLDKFDFAGGLTYSLAYSAIPEDGHRKPLTELRPVMEASHEFPLRGVFIQNRVRLDNRFLQTDRETNIFSASDYVFRFRYRIQVRKVLITSDDDNPVVSLRVGDEVMLNHKKNTFDQNRIYANVEYVLNKNFSVEGGYLFIGQRRFGRDEYFSRHIVRFTLFHKVFAY